jgi:hypothetical protein
MKPMAARLPFLLIVLFWGLRPARACDVCGVFVGVRPNQVGHRLELVLRSRVYGGYVRLPSGEADQSHPLFKTAPDPSLHGNGEPPRYDPSDYSRHLTAELRGAFFLSRRWQLLTILPYVDNRQQIASPEQRYWGWGDPTVLASWAAVQQDSGRQPVQWLLQGGGQLPFGRWARNATESHLLPGAGVPVALIGSSLGLRRGLWGGWLQGLARFMPQNCAGFRTANLYTLTATGFRDFQQVKGSTRRHFIPHVGAHYENHNGEFERGHYQYGTGGQLLFGLAGLEWVRGTWGLMCQVQLPLVQDLLGTQLGAGGRLNVGLSYTFAGRTLLR